MLGVVTLPIAPSEARVLSVVVGLALLTVAPRLWRGTRTAASLAIGCLLALAVLSLIKDHYDEAVLELCLCAMLAISRRSFPLGCRNRPRLAIVCAALGAWGVAYCALRLAPLVVSHPAHALVRALRHSVAHALRVTTAQHHYSVAWISVIDGLIGIAALISVLALRSLLRPVPGANEHVEHEYRAARDIVARYGEDSLSPFILRPDKALAFAAGGVLSYRVIRGTAIVSADPVAPEGLAPQVLAEFMQTAHRRGWQVAVWGASPRHIDAYRALGLHAVCAGEEAFVDPDRFTLEGRPVRKLRQSVHRVKRRGWTITVCEGRAIDGELEHEIGELDRQWRARQRHVHGFAMGMGPYESEVSPDDVYVLARSAQGRLGAVMRFIGHGGKLSLDTMRRVGETPNGLNEALVATALQAARERGVREVSLNYAGLAHIVRVEQTGSRRSRLLANLVLVPLGRRFQMERLVRFNDKFSPEWRPRYLVYEGRASLPRVIFRVLQVEGYVPHLGGPRLPHGWPSLPGAVARLPQARGIS